VQARVAALEKKITKPVTAAAPTSVSTRALALLTLAAAASVYSGSSVTLTAAYEVAASFPMTDLARNN